MQHVWVEQKQISSFGEKRNYMEEEKTQEINIKINFKGVGWKNMNLIMWLKVRTSGRHLSTD